MGSSDDCEGVVMTLRRPLLRYHGGKWRLAPWIIEHMPPHRVYVEPYGGAASVLLLKPRTYAEIYNDLDDEIVNVFSVARDHGEKLRDQLYNTPFARTEFELSYEPTQDPVERARRTIIRSFMGFGSNAITSKWNTGFRSNSSRSGTTPATDWRNYAEVFDGIIDRLRGVVIENKDALEVMAQHDSPETLHYVDPPYVFDTRSDLRKDYRHELTDDDHVELADFLKELQGMVILSGYRSELYDNLFGDWVRYDRAARADGAKSRTECLWLSCSPPQRRLI